MNENAAEISRTENWYCIVSSRFSLSRRDRSIPILHPLGKDLG